MMLVLRRRQGEKISISGPCVISVETLGQETVLLGFEADRAVSIVRCELLEQGGAFEKQPRLTPDEVNTLFPWDLWMDGNLHSATHGVDFPQEIEGFISLLRSRAQRTLLAVCTLVRGETVQFQFYEPKHSLQRRAGKRLAK